MIVVASTISVSCYGATNRVEISSGALLAPDNQMLWGAAINRAPGDKVQADVNPPRFRWAYVPNMQEIQLAEPGPKHLQVLYNLSSVSIPNSTATTN